MKNKFLIILLTLYFVSLTSLAHAYLDPGTGSMMLQILAASLIGGLFALKGYWSRIKVFFANILFKKKQ